MLVFGFAAPQVAATAGGWGLGHFATAYSECLFRNTISGVFGAPGRSRHGRATTFIEAKLKHGLHEGY